uniref:Chitin-binding type-2 domain-containing protein n=1 Tax=Caenorhabditis japonica TaxID=281687 RepID=A0A8R1HHE8_CAEJA
MILISFLVASIFVFEAKGGVLKPKGPQCPDGDGLYAVGCSSKYLQCVNNVEYERSCPDGLYFDRILARCERRSSNYLCNAGGRKILNVRQKAVTISCANRKSGDYPIDQNVCNANYYQCANGIFYMRKCPYNQYYSPVLKRCDYETNCMGTDGIKLNPAAAYSAPTYDHDNFVVTTKEVKEGHDGPKGVNCTTLGDATISELTCSPYFWQCTNGKLFRKSCPPGLIYVINQNLCDFPHSVKECPEFNGSETAYESAYVHPPTTTTTEAPTTKPETTPSYVTPRKTTTQQSPTTQPSYSQSIYAPPAAAPAVPPASQSYEPKTSESCKDKPDGFYEISPCHKNFLTCSNGKERLISCAHDLVYDSRVNACDFIEACQGPRKQEDVPQLHNHGGALDKKIIEVKVDFDCTEKEDGNYFKEACTKLYFRCHDRRAFAVTCPADLVYNKATETCDFAENCEKNYMEPTHLYANEEPSKDESKTAEYSQPPTVYSQPIIYTRKPTTVAHEQPKTTTQAPTTQILTTQVYTTTAATTPTPPLLDDFSCANLENGNFASGLCKSIFYTCSHNQLIATKCPENLVYNPYVGQCDYTTNVPDCRGQDQLVQDTPYTYTQKTTPPVSYTTTTASTTIKTTPVYAPVVNPYRTTLPTKYFAFCELLADGNYGEQCKPYFFKCADFETSLINCPAGLIYNLKTDACDHPQNVVGCPEYTPPTPNYLPLKNTLIPASDKPENRPVTRPHPNIDYTTKTPGPVDTTPIAEVFSCETRPDGIYALPYCTKDYVQCINGRSLLASCASDLFYSEKSGLCDYKDNISICKIRQGADIISNDACIGKSNGYYSAGCSSHYFSCIDEQIRKMVCPNKLKFCGKKGICDYPTDVAECGISVQQTNAPPAVPSDFCTIRPNGLHSFALCSAHYVVCENGIAIAGSCAAPLVFNKVNQLCDYRSNNKECGNDYVARTNAPGYYQDQYATPPNKKPTATTKGYAQPSTVFSKVYETVPTTTTLKPYEQPTNTATTVSTTTTSTTVAPTTTSRSVDDVPNTIAPYQPAATTNIPAQDTTEAFSHTTAGEEWVSY